MSNPLDIAQQRVSTLQGQVQAQNTVVQNDNAKVQQLNTELSKLRQSGASQADIEAKKKELDAASQQSQLDMIRLQQLVNQYNQAVELTSNILSKQGQLGGNKIGRIG